MEKSILDLPPELLEHILLYNPYMIPKLKIINKLFFTEVQYILSNLWKKYGDFVEYKYKIYISEKDTVDEIIISLGQLHGYRHNKFIKITSEYIIQADFEFGKLVAPYTKEYITESYEADLEKLEKRTDIHFENPKWDNKINKNLLPENAAFDDLYTYDDYIIFEKGNVDTISDYDEDEYLII